MDDVLGWRATRWGMTKADILHVIGANNLTETSRQDFRYVYSELEIKSVKIGEFDFDVVFQMGTETHRLEQVLVRYEDLDLRDPDPAFRTAKNILSETFGKPARDGTSDDWVWRFPTTVIEISKSYMPELWSAVYIRFRPATTEQSLAVAAF